MCTKYEKLKINIYAHTHNILLHNGGVRRDLTVRASQIAVSNASFTPFCNKNKWSQKRMVCVI